MKSLPTEAPPDGSFSPLPASGLVRDQPPAGVRGEDEGQGEFRTLKGSFVYMAERRKVMVIDRRLWLNRDHFPLTPSLSPNFGYSS